MKSIWQTPVKLHCVLTITRAVFIAACLTPLPAAAQFWNGPCNQAHDARYNIAYIDFQLLTADPLIGACGGDWNACLEARRILGYADATIEQILRWNSTGTCRKCNFGVLLGRAFALAQRTRALRAAAGPQLTINSDRTNGIVQSHLNLPGCCLPGTWWNNAINDCQPVGTGPPSGIRKNCQVTSSYTVNGPCNVWRRVTDQGLNYRIIINPMTPYNPPQGFLLHYSGPCAQVTRNEDIRCNNWRQ